LIETADGSFKNRAVRMVFDRLEYEDVPSRYTVIRHRAPKLNIAIETDAQAEIRKTKRENAELDRPKTR